MIGYKNGGTQRLEIPELHGNIDPQGLLKLLGLQK